MIINKYGGCGFSFFKYSDVFFIIIIFYVGHLGYVTTNQHPNE